MRAYGVHTINRLTSHRATRLIYPPVDPSPNEARIPRPPPEGKVRGRERDLGLRDTHIRGLRGHKIISGTSSHRVIKLTFPGLSVRYICL